MLIDGLIVGSIGLIGLGLLLAVLAGGNRGANRPSLQQRAEREDANGNTLLRLAAQMEACAADVRGGGKAPSHDELRNWARTCRLVAGDHLDTINALTLESLAKVETGAVHLGDYAPRHDLTASLGAEPAAGRVVRGRRSSDIWGRTYVSR